MTEKQKPDAQKAATVDRLSRVARTAFQEWKPSIFTPRIPLSVLRYLIPTRLLSAVSSPDSVGVSVIQNDGVDTRFLVLEHTNSEVTNAASLARFKSEMVRYRQARQAGNNPTPPLFPDDVDPPHLSYAQELQEGYLTLSDRFLLECYFSKLTPDHIHVTSYGDRDDLHGRGIATEFAGKFTNLARKLGSKYITSENFDQNIGFFVKQLGLSRLIDMPIEVQRVLRADLQYEPIEDFDKVTVATL